MFYPHLDLPESIPEMRRCYTNATDGVILMQSLTVISSDRVSQEIFALSYDLFIVLIILATLLVVQASFTASENVFYDHVSRMVVNT